jgi:hypothetical protein
LPAKLNRPQIRAIWKMGMNLLSAVCRATGHKKLNAWYILQRQGDLYSPGNQLCKSRSKIPQTV